MPKAPSPRKTPAKPRGKKKAEELPLEGESFDPTDAAPQEETDGAAAGEPFGGERTEVAPQPDENSREDGRPSDGRSSERIEPRFESAEPMNRPQQQAQDRRGQPQSKPGRN